MHHFYQTTIKKFKIKNSNSLEKKIFFKIQKRKSLLIADYKFFLSEMMMLNGQNVMANSLEVRSPFVDHKLIEYVLSHDKIICTKKIPN